MLFSSVGLLVSLVFIFSILGILRPVKKFIVDQFEKNIAPDTLVVRQIQDNHKTASLISLLRTKKDITLGITSEKVEMIRKWSEVKKISQTQILQKPAMGQFDHPVLSKMGIAFDLLIQGVSSDLVSQNLKCMKDFKPSVDVKQDGNRMEVVPLILPESFAEMAYAYTMMNGLPAVSKSNMIGLRLKLNIGQSVISGITGSSNEVIGVVCGFAPQNIVSILGVPLKWVRGIHLNGRQYKAANSYDKIFIQLKNIKDMETISNRLALNGLTVISGSNNSYIKVTKWLNNLDILLWTFVFILLFISAISLSNSFMILTTQKKYEFGLYLVFGASPMFLWMLIFFEGAFWGAFHSSLAYWIAENFYQVLQSSLRVIPYINEMNKTDMVFDFNITLAEKWYLISGSILFSGISSLIPAVLMTGKKTLSLIKKD
ncbi:MAG: hypothetical protein OEV66_09085 [Spirochaetia bacterium]|nr:hypothetical protein [Spirochaetia bacterium]